MHVQLPNKFGRDNGVARIKAALDQARPKIGGQATIEQEEWRGDTLHFAFATQGQGIAGTFEVTDTEFVLDAKLPFMMRLFEGKIEAAIKEQVSSILK